MLLVNSQDDPLVPEKLLETPKKYVNSMYDYTIVVELNNLVHT
jgi:predicted alpha/beta-fold hydrolase